MQERVLIFQNSAEPTPSVRAIFDSLRLEVVISSEPAKVLEILDSHPPRLVVLDISWSGRSGAELCREIRSRAPKMPLLVLSEGADVLDKVLLLEMGADDYITKPFSPRELLARVRVALRRNQAKHAIAAQQAYTFDAIQINFESMELFREGKPVPMTKQEFNLLKFFVTNKQRVVSRNELLNAVWGYQNYPTTRTVDTHVCRLRRKLEKDPLEPVYFRTVYGTGYKFVG